jgi:hypothetical protein
VTAFLLATTLLAGAFFLAVVFFAVAFLVTPVCLPVNEILLIVMDPGFLDLEAVFRAADFLAELLLIINPLIY